MFSIITIQLLCSTCELHIWRNASQCTRQWRRL